LTAQDRKLCDCLVVFARKVPKPTTDACRGESACAATWRFDHFKKSIHSVLRSQCFRCSSALALGGDATYALWVKGLSSNAVGVGTLKLENSSGAVVLSCVAATGHGALPTDRGPTDASCRRPPRDAGGNFVGQACRITVPRSTKSSTFGRRSRLPVAIATLAHRSPMRSKSARGAACPYPTSTTCGVVYSATAR
jgi:hypothetical protein